MGNTISRRTFVGGAAAAATAAVVGQGTAASATPRRKRVLVLGAGLAGLAAAYELLRIDPSLDIRVLEGQARVGGRVLTARADDTGRPFADDQYVELGAHRIPDSHDRTLAYIDELGLTDRVVPFTAALPDGTESRRKYHLRGRAFYSDEPWPDRLQLTEGERADLWAMYWEYEYKYVLGDRPPLGDNALGDIVVPWYGTTQWPYGDSDRAAVDRWNALTHDEFLVGNGASKDWLRVYKADNGSEPRSISALAWLVQDVLMQNWNETLYLDGGLDQIAEGLARRLVDAGIPVLTGHEILGLEQDTTGATVRYRDRSRAVRTLSADRVICTLPFSALRGRRVDLRRARLSADKRYWIDHLAMVAGARVALQTRERFWQSEGVEGLHLAGTDAAPERVWHSTNTQPGTAGILQSYMQDRNAENAPTRGTADWLRGQVAATVFPQIDSAPGWNGQAASKLWHRDPWVYGAWSSPRPGDLVRGFAVWGRAEGRIHFAGEHTSLYSGWMQGALESAQRAAAEAGAAL